MLTNATLHFALECIIRLISLASVLSLGIALFMLPALFFSNNDWGIHSIRFAVEFSIWAAVLGIISRLALATLSTQKI